MSSAAWSGGRFRITAPVNDVRRLTFSQPAFCRPLPYGRPITVPTDSDSICAARAGCASFQTTGLRQRRVLVACRQPRTRSFGIRCGKTRTEEPTASSAKRHETTILTASETAGTQRSSGRESPPAPAVAAGGIRGFRFRKHDRWPPDSGTRLPDPLPWPILGQSGIPL